MSYSKQNAVRKMIALVLSLIMLFGVVAPSLSYAENTEPSGSTLEESTSVIADPMKEEGEEPTLEPPIDQAPTLADWEQAGIHMEQFAYDGMVETAVLKDLEELGYADVIIRLNEQPEMEQLSAAAATITNRVDRIEMVVDQLQQVAESARTSIEPMIRELEARIKRRTLCRR
ncbi:MAG TPA: hypothetical protein GXZ74_04015 [Tissierellia bacterium]|nr:hypothetical protein [Tissierellia bacterium]